MAAFLNGHVRFIQIADLIARALDRVSPRPLDSIETCVDVDTETRRLVESWLPAAAAAGSPGRVVR